VIEAGAAVLLTGWEGTLTYASARPQPLVPKTPSALAEPLVSEADNRLRSLSSRAEWRLGDAAVPVEQLLPALRKRIEAVYTMGVAMRRADPTAPDRRLPDILARTLLEDWVVAVRLFLLRLGADAERLARWQGLPALPSIASLTTAASEVHGSAGAVLRLRFGGGLTIFYKPRRVTGESLWAEWNAAVAEVDEEISVPTARVLAGGLVDRGGPGASGLPSYGWMENLARGSCAEKVHWQRAGALLCLAHHVGLSDLHMSNVVATAGGPAVLDAECLGGVISSRHWQNDGAEDVQGSLLATGLLPNAERWGAFQLPDVSGLFGGAAPVPGVLLPCWTGSQAEIRELRFVPARLLEQRNRPSRTLQPLLALPEILSGYARAALALLGIRPHLLRRGGWVDRFETQHSPRVVLRSTLSYGLMLSRSLLAERLPSEEIRQGMLRSELERASLDAGIPTHAGILEDELQALLRLRVPSFHLAAGTRDVVAEGGRVLVRDAASHTPANAIRHRLKGLGRNGMEETVKAELASILFRACRAGNVIPR